MNPKLLEIKDRFVEKLGFLGSLFGFNKLLGQIYGLLYLSPTPLSLDEITKQLQVSKGSISLNIRELEKWGGCKKVWVKGDRKDYYEAETQFKNILNKRLMDALKRRVSTVGEIAADTSALYPESEQTQSLSPEEKKLLSFYKNRIESLDKIQSKLDFLLKTLMKFL
ncbi:MAG: HTH domain-containing protein [Candidatus Aureabacteria bacterium]|nr:HTH domain-containing protein [Candidatus Auribacterota bacterium]